MISIIIYNTRRGLHLICISCECYSYITRICSLSIHISIIKHKVTMVTVEIENSTDSTTTLIFPGNQALLTTTVSVNSHKNKLVVTRKKRRRRKWQLSPIRNNKLESNKFDALTKKNIPTEFVRHNLVTIINHKGSHQYWRHLPHIMTMGILIQVDSHVRMTIKELCEKCN